MIAKEFLCESCYFCRINDKVPYFELWCSEKKIILDSDKDLINENKMVYKCELYSESNSFFYLTMDLDYDLDYR